MELPYEAREDGLEWSQKTYALCICYTLIVYIVTMAKRGPGPLDTREVAVEDGGTPGQERGLVLAEEHLGVSRKQVFSGYGFERCH